MISSGDSNNSKNFEGSNETSLYVKSSGIEIMIGNETDEIMDQLFASLLRRYQEGLEESTRENNLVYNGVDLFYYKLHKISLNRGG